MSSLGIFNKETKTYQKVAGTAEAAVLDAEMSDTSTNTVQNKVIKKYVDDSNTTKLDKTAKPAKASTDKAFKKTFKTTANLRMRTSPDTSDNSNVIQVLKKGTKVIGTGKCLTVGTQKWLEVKSGGKIGYCSKKYLK